MLRTRALATSILATVAITVAPIALAQSVEQQASVLTHQLMSPYCPGLVLADCRSEGAQELRAEIRRRLETGEPANTIEEDLVIRFGSSIRTVPPLEGIGLVVWIGPLILGLAAFLVLVIAVRRATRRNDPSRQSVDASPQEDPEMEGRLQDELDQFD
jgi:cytochrome c-type biogenesis protein CcmH/NrfF